MEPNTYFASELDTKSEKPKSICPSSNTVNWLIISSLLSPGVDIGLTSTAYIAYAILVNWNIIS
jgi:hypothetical protein